MKARIPNSGAPSNMQGMIRQAQKMQEQMEKAQAELELREYEASAGGGLVSVVVTGKYQIKTIKISPDAIDSDDLEMVEDFVTVAVNEAMRKASETYEAEMAKLSGGVNLPF